MIHLIAVPRWELIGVIIIKRDVEDPRPVLEKQKYSPLREAIVLGTFVLFKHKNILRYVKPLCIGPSSCLNRILIQFKFLQFLHD